MENLLLEIDDLGAEELKNLRDYIEQRLDELDNGTDGNHRCLLIPLDGPMRIVEGESEFKAIDCWDTEAYAISPTHSLVCRTQKQGTLNPHMLKFGGQFMGACLIVKENSEGYVDIEDNIVELLPKIMENDRRKREEYTQMLASMGATVINV